ncbi:TonB-dependent receptor [Brevundimonas terrae]|uniref:TonB-dependent receptor n=1 Tax=Brevundimonas terrae TaxID=363631 RepID=A0ABN0Y4X2_9CAUL|nr:TonB-dependent receptor [Brevundimonas terrae]NIJ25641.1 iron complex outermembrane receptor protein [Brevundimonas terrae]
MSNFARSLTFGASAIAIALGMATTASAQSTGSEAFEVEQVVVTGTRGPRAIEGVVAENNPKSRATITEQYIGTQAAGQTILNSINLLPGVNFTNNDAYGSAGGDLTIRGFDSARVSLTQDGIPMNDTGNYAIYSNQQMDPELIQRAAVNLGTTDVDSPTASATGGTVNYVTRRPSEEFGVIFQPSLGEYGYRRAFGLVETGEFGPWGTRAWFAASKTKYDHFVGAGGVDKMQLNGRIYQPLGDNGDFVSLTAHYNENRNQFMPRVSLADFEKGGAYDKNDYNTVRSQATAVNPSNTGNIRGQSRFTLSDKLTLTVDPSFQYTLAHGGGTHTTSETDPQLIGNSSAAGVDLNGDGKIDPNTKVTLFRPNITNTHRYGVTSSLIWNVSENHQLRGAYTFDWGRHRQTGQMGYIDANGFPEDWFAGRNGRPVELPDGTVLRRRDRLSYAMLNQIAAEYRGSFFNNAVDLTVGVRAPFFDRELNNYCYQRDTFNAYCTTETPSVVNPDGTVQFPSSAMNSNANNKYRAPVSFDKKYDAVLPNLGVTWKFGDSQSIYASYAEGFSAPRTDDLYDVVDVNPEPETTNSYDIGYRFQSGTLIASIAAWKTDYANRIVRTYDEAADMYLTRNVGDVTLQGIDGQIGWSPIENLSLTGSFTYTDSEVKNDLPNGIKDGVAQFIPTAGNQLVETPDWQFGGRVAYTIGDFDLGLQGKYVGERFANDINTEVAPDYLTFDLDVRYNLKALGKGNSYLQLNVINLFDEEYLADISTQTDRAASYQLGAPRTAMITLRASF